MAARRSTRTTVCKRTLVYPICIDPKTKRFRAPGPRMAGCYSELRTVCRSRKTGAWAPRPHRGRASNRTEGTRMATKMPTVAQVVAALQAENKYLTKNKIPETDVRLQVYPNGDWALRTGDSSYAQDHRGYWGASSIAKGRLPLGVAREIAKDLIRQADDQAAEDEDNGARGRVHGRMAGRTQGAHLSRTAYRAQIGAPQNDSGTLSRAAYRAKVKRLLKGLYTARSAPTILPLIDDGYAMGRGSLHTSRMIAGSYGWKGR